MRKLFILLLLFCATQLMAQKIDPLLTSTLERHAKTEANAKSRNAGKKSLVHFEVDTAATKKTLNVSFNPDGTVRSFVVLAKTNGMPATLPQGVLLKEKIGSILILDVKAEALDTLSEVPEIEYIKASEIHELHNERARRDMSSAYVTGELSGYDVPTFGAGQGSTHCCRQHSYKLHPL